MRNKFDMQLERLNSQLTHMGEMCEIAIPEQRRLWKMVRLMRRKSVQEADEEIDQIRKDSERALSKASVTAAAGSKRSSPDFSGT